MSDGVKLNNDSMTVITDIAVFSVHMNIIVCERLKEEHMHVYLHTKHLS